MKTIYSIFLLLLISACSGSPHREEASRIDDSNERDTSYSLDNENTNKTESTQKTDNLLKQNQEYCDIGEIIFQNYIDRKIDSVYNYFPSEESWQWVFKQTGRRLQDYNRKKNGIKNILNEKIQGDETREIDNNNLKIDSVECAFIPSEEKINLNKTTVFFSDGNYRLKGEVLLYTFKGQKYLYPIGGIKYKMAD